MGLHLTASHPGTISYMQRRMMQSVWSLPSYIMASTREQQYSGRQSTHVSSVEYSCNKWSLWQMHRYYFLRCPYQIQNFKYKLKHIANPTHYFHWTDWGLRPVILGEQTKQFIWNLVSLTCEKLVNDKNWKNTNSLLLHLTLRAFDTGFYSVG